MNSVYRALNVQTGDFIAIKQIEKAVIQPEHLPGILVRPLDFHDFPSHYLFDGLYFAPNVIGYMISQACLCYHFQSFHILGFPV